MSIYRFDRNRERLYYGRRLAAFGKNAGLASAGVAALVNEMRFNRYVLFYGDDYPSEFWAADDSNAYEYIDRMGLPHDRIRRIDPDGCGTSIAVMTSPLTVGRPSPAGEP